MLCVVSSVRTDETAVGVALLAGAVRAAGLVETGTTGAGSVFTTVGTLAAGAGRLCTAGAAIVSLII